MSSGESRGGVTGGRGGEERGGVEEQSPEGNLLSSQLHNCPHPSMGAAYFLLKVTDFTLISTPQLPTSFNAGVSLLST